MPNWDENENSESKYKEQLKKDIESIQNLIDDLENKMNENSDKF